ncbi:cytochrome b/b6 domain-containing protein [Aeromonas caviae]|uniref:cytochrome b/b6 domain-containing protein n=1 Tax=Aeromonas caviae TaxID=648 RepID=UPI00191F4C0D|nr:cytochrome b/b6 domain-containing protein [Aeromonas caviae]MBL0449456.1 cytochrome b/b6 domain-containing protein [Aeromonas caviae]
MGKTMQNYREIKVWDPVVRGFHWATVLLCVLNLFILEEGARNHRYAGYALAGLLVLRIVWGFIGSYHARFTQWLPTPVGVITYLKETVKGHHPYYSGHNPLGSLMILLLLTCLVGTAASGIMTEYGPLSGTHRMEEIHEFFAKGLQVAIFVHVLAVIALDRLVRGDLVRAMITGKKRVPADTRVVDRP